MGGPPREPRGVENGGREWQALSEGQEGLGCPPVRLGGVGRLSQRDERGRVAHFEAQERPLAHPG